jgi:hypothetical protein
MKFYGGFITCPSLLVAAGITVAVTIMKDFNTVYISFSRKRYLSGRCAVSSNEVCNNVNLPYSRFFNINLLVNLVNV